MSVSIGYCMRTQIGSPASEAGGKLRPMRPQFVVSPVGVAHMKGEAGALAGEHGSPSDCVGRVVESRSAEPQVVACGKAG
jgi:hypothetical protein